MISLENFKKYLKIENTDTSQDDQLNLAISNANWFLEAYLWYSLELDAAKIVFFDWYKSSFELNHVNINEVSAVEVTDDEFTPSRAATTVDFRTYEDKWQVKTRDAIWPLVRITYSFWYTDVTCPNDLQAILYDVAAMNFKSMWEISIWDLKSESVDGDQITFKDITWSLSPNALVLLDKYKQYEFSS